MLWFNPFVRKFPLIEGPLLQAEHNKCAFLNDPFSSINEELTLAVVTAVYLFAGKGARQEKKPQPTVSDEIKQI